LSGEGLTKELEYTRESQFFAVCATYNPSPLFRYPLNRKTLL